MTQNQEGKESNTTVVVASIIVGAIVGAISGYLLAQDEVRAEIKKMADEGTQAVKDKVDEVKKAAKQASAKVQEKKPTVTDDPYGV